MTICPAQKVWRRNRRQNGQTLILGVIAILILTVLIILFFNIRSVIRGKVNGQNAVDAAALTAANWQKESLNMIGELNLLKASCILLTDPDLGAGEIQTYAKAEPADDREVAAENLARAESDIEKLTTALNLLDQLQTRVAFVGPLIGFGASQQAAKNNGIAVNNNGTADMYDLFLDQQSGFFAEDGYISELPEKINQYEWKEPYRQMVTNIISQGHGKEIMEKKGIGLAVFPNVHGMAVHATDDFFTNRHFYDAVIADDWCALQDFLDQTDPRKGSGNCEILDLESAYWDKLTNPLDSLPFLEECEILPLHIDFISGTLSQDEQKAVSVFLKKRNTKLLSDVFDNQAPAEKPEDYTWENRQITLSPDKDFSSPINPDDTDLRLVLPVIHWAKYDSSWEEYDSDTVSAWRSYFRSGIKDEAQYTSGAIAYMEISQPQTLALNSNGKQTFSVNTNATAKAFGYLTVNGKKVSPLQAGCLILPVFTETALIPTALETRDAMTALDMDWYYYLKEFLPTLLNGSSMEDEIAGASGLSHYNRYSRYVNALKKAMDPNWRLKGLTWLETPIEWENDSSGGKSKVIRTNRDTCNRWPSGGNGGRWGPGSLH